LLSEVEIEKTDKNGRTIYEMKQIGENHWSDCIYYNLALGYFFRKTTSFDNKNLEKQIQKRKRIPMSEQINMDMDEI
jgi:hypothetical protein